MRNKVVGVSVIASIIGTAACAPRSGSAGSSLAYVGAGLAAVGGTIALVMAESGPSGGGSDFSGIGALPGLLFLGGAGTISTASGLIALLSPSSTSSGVPRESGPPIATTDERVARWADVARRMAASRQCVAAGRMLSFIGQRRPGADGALRIELSPSCPRLGIDTLPSE